MPASVGKQTLENAQTATLSSNTLFMQDGATWQNDAGAVFDFTDDFDILFNGGTRPQFTNAGTVEKTGGTGTSSIGHADFTTTGLVDAQTGTLSLGGGGSSTGGTC